MKVVALKLEAMKQIRGDCSSVGKTGYDVPNIGTTNWPELVELIESAHSFVSVLYNSTSDKVDVSAMVNTAILLGSKVTKEYISGYLQLLKSQLKLEISGMVGWHLLTEGVKLGCSVEENDDLLSLFAKYEGFGQGADTLQGYLTKFGQIVNRLDEERGRSTDPTDSVHKFINGMDKAVKAIFMSRYSAQHPNERYEWSLVRNLVSAMKDYKSRTYGKTNNGGTKRAQGGSVVATSKV